MNYQYLDTDRVKKILLGKNWTQAELGKRLGKRVSAINAIINARDPISVKVLHEAAFQLGVKYYEILSISEKEREGCREADRELIA
jgi:transcriptional regulator with XRE-family HTH domain